jgi:rhomboid protease GluP
MPQCLRCGADLQVNEEGIAPVLCDRCAGVATSRARRGLSTGSVWDYPATTVLVGINVAVLIGMLLTGGIGGAFGNQNPISFWGANISPLTLSGEYWRLITAGFIHAGFLHIAFNMWCLWSLGQLSEKLFGTWITVAVYLLTGVGGSLLSSFINPTHSEVGASGAIFGIAGAILSGVKFGNVAVPSWQKKSITSSLIFFTGFNLYLGAAIPGIDNWCHIGGLITGLVFGVPLATANASGKKSYEWMTILLAALVLAGLGKGVMDVKGQSSRLMVAELELRQHNYAAAIQLLEKSTASDPQNAEAEVMLGYAYQMSDQRDKAAAAYKRALQIDPNNADAQEGLKELQDTAPESQQK